MSLSVDKLGTKAQVSIPCLSFGDFDRNGNLSPIALQGLLTITRLYSFHTPDKNGQSFLDYDTMTKETFTFIGSTETEISKDYYSIPDCPIVPKLAVNMHLSSIGSSSLNTVAELVDEKTGKLLARNHNQVISVNKITRKPTPFPDWWKKKYAGAVGENKSAVIEVVSKPAVVHTFVLQVPWMDIDIYNHTNFLNYTKYCFDAAMDGISANVFSKITDDITKFQVHKFNILYKGESIARDELHIHVWENQCNPYKLHFQIDKENITIHQSRVEFYAPMT